MKSLIGKSRFILLLSGASLLTSCFFGGPPKCDTEAGYQLSEGGERIEVPEDLNDLQSYKEMTIPEASPQQQNDSPNRCLEMPPPISSGSSN
ncbi:MAG: hypothetical protein ACE5FV_14120 [Woeseia sp.]